MSSGQREFNCPNCGAALGARFAVTRMVTCDHCGSTVLLEDEAVRRAGDQGVMSEQPSLIAMNEPFAWKDWQATPIGHARFDYDHGWWDEWWAVDGKGDGAWISVDEGDIAIERPWAPFDVPALDWERLAPGARIVIDGETFIVTETGTATCSAVRGELPELLQPGDSYRYLHLSGPGARLVTAEIEGGEASFSEGVWVDPFALGDKRAGAT